MKIEYCEQAPSNQTIVDIFKDKWYSAFPDELGVVAGQVRHFDYRVEPRVKWAESVIPGGLKGRSVLELGPFEAYNTWMLDQFGASPILAIEANNLSYLKCLIVKELTGLKARFLHGDFLQYLEKCADHYDIVWASGVLYHQMDPLRLLDLITSVTNRIFIHTHYYDETVMAAYPGIAAPFVKEKNVEKECDGYKAIHHYYSYRPPVPPPETLIQKGKTLIKKQIGKVRERPFEKGGVFSGGPKEYSYWLEQKDIYGFLKKRGFVISALAIDHKTNPNGPAMVFYTERKE